MLLDALVFFSRSIYKTRTEEGATHERQVDRMYIKIGEANTAGQKVMSDIPPCHTAERGKATLMDPGRFDRGR